MLIIFKNQCFSIKIDIKKEFKKYILNLGTITRGIISLFLSKQFLKYLMDPIDFTNNQNAICRVI